MTDGVDDNGNRAEVRWAFMFLWLTFLGYSFLHAPIPGANEPHYLCKARHLWEPSWCERDLFLSSSNPHLVFYVVVGWTARWLSFEMMAVVARVVSYGCLASGWLRLCRVLGLTPRGAVTSSWWLLCMNSVISLSGEWLVGGCESKVLAYAAVLTGVAHTLNHHWRRAAIQLGLAVAFHPLVGGWSVIALAGGMIFNARRELMRRDLKFALWALPLFLMVASTGLVPALASLRGASRSETFTANYLQVFYRLSHHLDPLQFPRSSYWSYAILFVIGWWASNRRRPTEHWSVWRGFVLVAVLIAACGWLAGWGPRPHPERMPGFAWRMQFLKFYPFRLADAVVPMLCALGLTQRLTERRQWLSGADHAWRRDIVWAGAAYLISLLIGIGSGSARYLADDRERDWLSVCKWVRQQTEPQAMCVTPNESWGFKWFADRAEYVAFKDCPQDAASLVEWNKRLKSLLKWHDRVFEDLAYSPTELQELHRLTGAEYFITREDTQPELAPVYVNGSYTVYRIASAE